MKVKLKKDVVIPAGTILTRAPTHTSRSDSHVDTLIGLTKDSCGSFEYYIDSSDPALAEWFEIIEE